MRGRWRRWRNRRSGQPDIDGMLGIAPPPRNRGSGRAGRWRALRSRFVDGKNLGVDLYRSTEGDESQIPGRLQDLMDLNVEVLVVHATGILGALRATKTMP